MFLLMMNASGGECAAANDASSRTVAIFSRYLVSELIKSLIIREQIDLALLFHKLQPIIKMGRHEFCL